MLIEPIKGRKEVDEEIKKYKEQFNYDEGRLCNVIDQEYREIFETNSEIPVAVYNRNKKRWEDVD